MKLLSGISKTAVLMLVIISILFFLFCVAGLLVIINVPAVYAYEKPLPYCVGLFSGCLLSAVKLLFIHNSLAKVMDLQDDDKAKSYASLQAILRHVGTIAVMLCAVFFPKLFGVFGLVIGILTLRLTAFIAGRMIDRHPDSFIEDGN
ncbi:MAG: hypothetical protein FWE66_00220 [Oscillospiraceae bacterium]|nr:hypothetical protein [Oscillospiraceae bacterium]